MLDEGSLEKVTFALDLLVSLEAKDEDYAKLFSKTRINKLMKYNGGHTVCSPGTSGVIFNLLANHLHPYPEVFSVLDEAFDGLGGNTRRSLTISITTLEAPAAEILSKRSHPTGTRGYDMLDLNGLTELSDSAAESLSKYRGESLSLRSLTELSDAAAESLSKIKGQLNLNGLTELSDAAAESLSKHKECLSLEGLTELSDAAAESLSKHENLGLDCGLEEQVAQYR
ncbi:MAG: hypothetical protein CMH58_03065 [Myxococcales bacterium]|nr:hypothetical protein [Myxococcales bacterium]